MFNIDMVKNCKSNFLSLTIVQLMVDLNNVLTCVISSKLIGLNVCDRNVEGTWPQDHHDRYTDRPAVVHLRLCQSLLPPAPPPTARDARVSQTQARTATIMTT